MKNQKIISTEQSVMKSHLAKLLVIARLTWGDLMSPLNWYYNSTKLFPPPRKSVYKKGLVNYFFRN